MLGCIAERRLADARRLLVETNMAVGEFGWRVGYEDPAYFTRSSRPRHSTLWLATRRSP